jgi:hypothetical protein
MECRSIPVQPSDTHMLHGCGRIVDTTDADLTQITNLGKISIVWFDQAAICKIEGEGGELWAL